VDEEEVHGAYGLWLMAYLSTVALAEVDGVGLEA
jgi:hypothetical protein